jgi:hypothetical protein
MRGDMDWGRILDSDRTPDSIKERKAALKADPS